MTWVLCKPLDELKVGFKMDDGGRAWCFRIPRDQVGYRLDDEMRRGGKKALVWAVLPTLCKLKMGSLAIYEFGSD